MYSPNIQFKSHGQGIIIKYEDKLLKISGWFDTMCHLEGGQLTLAEFFDKLGITEKDCEKAFIELAISKN